MTNPVAFDPTIFGVVHADVPGEGIPEEIPAFDLATAPAERTPGRGTSVAAGRSVEGPENAAGPTG